MALNNKYKLIYNLHRLDNRKKMTVTAARRPIYHSSTSEESEDEFDQLKKDEFMHQQQLILRKIYMDSSSEDSPPKYIKTFKSITNKVRCRKAKAKAAPRKTCKVPSDIINLVSPSKLQNNELNPPQQVAMVESSNNMLKPPYEFLAQNSSVAKITGKMQNLALLPCTQSTPNGRCSEQFLLTSPFSPAQSFHQMSIVSLVDSANLTDTDKENVSSERLSSYKTPNKSRSKTHIQNVVIADDTSELCLQIGHSAHIINVTDENNCNPEILPQSSESNESTTDTNSLLRITNRRVLANNITDTNISNSKSDDEATDQLSPNSSHKGVAPSIYISDDSQIKLDGTKNSTKSTGSTDLLNKSDYTQPTATERIIQNTTSVTLRKRSSKSSANNLPQLERNSIMSTTMLKVSEKSTPKTICEETIHIVRPKRIAHTIPQSNCEISSDESATPTLDISLPQLQNVAPDSTNESHIIALNDDSHINLLDNSIATDESTANADPDDVSFTTTDEPHDASLAPLPLSQALRRLTAGKWRRSVAKWKHEKESSTGRRLTMVTAAPMQRQTNLRTFNDTSVLQTSVNEDRPSRGPPVVRFADRSVRFASHSVSHLSNICEQTPEQIVLNRCGQTEPLPFNVVYSESRLPHLRKIGEGVFGEVFMYRTSPKTSVVLKIIPIEGNQLVNGEPQKKFHEILPEIIIAAELSNLRNGRDFKTSGFVQLLRVRYVRGCYPQHLIEQWELFRDNRGTENDDPDEFDPDQLFIVLEQENAGVDLEAFKFRNSAQSLGALQQIALTLAVAEQRLQFEHRDLHWGNILLAPTEQPELTFILNGQSIVIPSNGVKVTIIDYTLSRMVYNDQVLHNDLAKDEELFSADGDYQFTIYRLMRERLGNNWTLFNPYTNVLWLHYIVDKLIDGARYQSTRARVHWHAMEKLMAIRDEFLDHKSATALSMVLVNFVV